MKIVDIINFINPFGDMLSTVFILLLVSLSIATMIWLIVSAKVENWESNWNGEHLEDNTSLDSEHGSVHELAEAVSTKAEQVADIMPSMLLVIGLLGTFIGLGIALNSASEVLANANTSGMDNAMTNLMALMEGLGAKFKTSTWGLLCFIALNIFFNILGFKEKRLAWAIAKIKQETNIKNAQKNKLEQDKYNELLSSILNFNKETQASSHTHQELLNKNLKIQFDGLKANLNAIQTIEQQLKQQHTTLLDGLNTHNIHVVSMLKQGFEQYVQQMQHTSQNQIIELQNIINTNQTIIELSKHNNQNLIQSLKQQNQEVVNTLNEGFQQHIDQLHNNSKQHIDALKNIVTSNQAIQKASEVTTNELKNVIHSLTSGFKNNSEQLRKGSEQSLIELKKIADYNKQTQIAMQDFVEKAVSSISSIGDSANKMGESAQAVGKSANDLNNVVQTLKSELSDVMSMIKNDLGGTINDMNDSFKENITEMSASIQENMTEMSESMGNATKGIENAVENLSVNVGQTMNDVTQTIGKSMDLQEKSAREFMITSTSLNEQILTMTNLVQQLSDDIVGSLKSVAENGRRMDNIGRKLEGFSEFFEILSNTNPQIINHLDKVADSNKNINQTLAEISEKTKKNDLSEQTLTAIKNMQNELLNLNQLISQYYQTNQYQHLLEKIIDNTHELIKNHNSTRQES